MARSPDLEVTKPGGGGNTSPQSVTDPVTFLSAPSLLQPFTLKQNETTHTHF